MHAPVGLDTPARACRFSVIDFETTGSVAGWPVEPWQVGIVTVAGGAVSAQSAFESLLRVGERPFNPNAPGRHAALRDELRTAPSPAELWPALAARLCGQPLAAHNTGTERGVLAKLAPLHRFGPWVDTLALTRRCYPGMTSKALDEALGELGLTQRVRALCPGRDAHDALYDAFACAVLLEHFLALPGWESVTLGALLL